MHETSNLRHRIAGWTHERKVSERRSFKHHHMCSIASRRPAAAVISPDQSIDDGLIKYGTRVCYDARGLIFIDRGTTW